MEDGAVLPQDARIAVERAGEEGGRTRRIPPPAGGPRGNVRRCDLWCNSECVGGAYI